MKVLWQSAALFITPLLLFILLKFIENIEKPRFASIQAQAACSLVYRRFSNSNTQGYPQE